MELGEGTQHLLDQGISECQGDCAENPRDFFEHASGISISLSITCALGSPYTVCEWRCWNKSY